MPIMLRRAWFWGLHEEIEKPHLFHFVFLVNHNRIVMWELGAKGYIPKTDAWCEHAFTQVMNPRIRLHLEFTPNDRQPRIRLMKPHGNFPIQYLQHTICRKNAAQQARRNPGDPRSRPETRSSDVMVYDVYTGGNLLCIMQHFQARISTYGFHLTGILLGATFFS